MLCLKLKRVLLVPLVFSNPASNAAKPQLGGHRPPSSENLTAWLSRIGLFILRVKVYERRKKRLCEHKGSKFTHNTFGELCYVSRFSLKLRSLQLGVKMVKTSGRQTCSLAVT